MSCTLCLSEAPRPGCPRCELRQPSLFELPPPPPPSEEELARAGRAEQLRLERIAEKRGRLVALGTLDRPAVVVLVGCAKHKASSPAPASDLYRGALFRLSLAYALQAGDLAFILSALHGLVELDEELKPYDYPMKELRVVDRERWAERVTDRLSVETKGLRPRFVGLAGEEYLKPLFLPFARRGWLIEKPLERMGVGSRIGWLKRALDPPTTKKRPRRKP